MTPAEIEFYNRARRLFPASIDIEKRMEQYRALKHEHDRQQEKEEPCDASSQS